MAVSHVFSNAVADWTGTVTVFNSQGSTTSAIASAIVRPSDWNSAHNQFYTLTGNTTNQSTASGTNVVFGASGPSISIAGSTGTIVISSPPHVSSMEFPPEGPNSAAAIISTNSGSVSFAVEFNVKQPISASFLRFAASMHTNSTTFATTGASLSASAELYSTWNAVVYSLGTGASSKSLISVASGSAGFTFRNSISVAANGTQYSVTEAVTFPAEGGTTTSSTQYSISNTNYSFSCNFSSNFSGSRWIDVNFANSLPAGAYWALIGQTTSSNTNSTGMAPATNCNVKCAGTYAAATQLNATIGVMGSTNLTSVGALIGAGSFSTAGGGTTSALPISAISSFASHAQIYFQLLRSA